MVRIAKDLVVDYEVGDHKASRANACTYCGSTISITRDHVIPVSWSRPSRDYSAGDTVKCCSECNSTLGDVCAFSVETRAQFLIGSYIKKYRKIFKLPEWSDSDMEGMDETLKSTIKASMFEREFIVRRMSHLTAVVGSGDLFEVKQVTIDHVSAYKAFTSAFNACYLKSLPEFQMEYDKESGSSIFNKFLRSSDYYCTRVQWLYDHKMNLDLSLEKVLNASFRARRKKK